MLGAAIGLYLILVILSVYGKSVKYSEKWNENGKQKSLTTGIQEMHQDNFILEQITSKFLLEHLLTPTLNG